MRLQIKRRIDITSGLYWNVCYLFSVELLALVSLRLSGSGGRRQTTTLPLNLSADVLHLGGGGGGGAHTCTSSLVLSSTAAPPAVIWLHKTHLSCVGTSLLINLYAHEHGFLLEASTQSATDKFRNFLHKKYPYSLHLSSTYLGVFVIYGVLTVLTLFIYPLLPLGHAVWTQHNRV